MSSWSARYPVGEGPGPVSRAAQLPAGFTDTFTSRFVAAGAGHRLAEPAPEELLAALTSFLAPYRAGQAGG
ncbi:hypothetical protein [Micromonospora avicenniae]|uniref:hypothetical protein n=1 Tax=Micromonospora avicenniae TaxID=1198245 RepID=UPI00343ADF89